MNVWRTVRNRFQRRKRRRKNFPTVFLTSDLEFVVPYGLTTGCIPAVCGVSPMSPGSFVSSNNNEFVAREERLYPSTMTHKRS